MVRFMLYLTRENCNFLRFKLNRTDPSLNPSSPPSSFVLPQATISYTSSPTRSDPTSRLKITTEWKWLDSEWMVVTSPNQITSSASPFASSPTTSSIPISTATALTTPTSSSNSVADPTLFKNYEVDKEGWQYGDNHFEKLSKRGGLGSYTRRRAWIRRAGLVERCERVTGHSNTISNGTPVKEEKERKTRRSSSTIKKEGKGETGKGEIRRRKSSSNSIES